MLTPPDQLAAVAADRDLIPRAIEENLRYETPHTTEQRNTAEDAVLEGVKIPAHSLVDVCIGSANRDENRWERPEEFDIFRKPVPHISSPPGSTPAWDCTWHGWKPAWPSSAFSTG